MYEEYLLDSYYFYELGKDYKKGRNKQECKKYFRASIFYLFSVIDGYINFIADEDASLLRDELQVYIADKKYRFSTSTYSTEKVTEYHPVISKLKLIIRVFAPEYNLKTAAEWQHLMNLKKLRDRIVHPGTDEDIVSPDEYETVIENGLKSIINLLNMLTQKIFGRSLKRKLLDLL